MSVSSPNKNFVRFIQNSALTYNGGGEVTLYFPAAAVGETPITKNSIGVFTGFTICDSLASSAISTTAFYLVVNDPVRVDGNWIDATKVTIWSVDVQQITSLTGSAITIVVGGYRIAVKATLLATDTANINKVPVPGITEDKYFLKVLMPRPTPL